MQSSPRVSIITVAYNASATIGGAVASTTSQRFTDFEHLLIDGASKDDTVARARAAGDARLVVRSERDRGIYDAMNKGLAMARGEFCLYLNADDRFASDEVLGTLVAALDRHRADVAYGDVRIVSAGGVTTRVWRAGRFRGAALSLGWITPHPGFTARTELLRRVGGFRLEYPIAADYDLMLRTLRALGRRKPVYVPRELVVMQQGGASTASLRQMWRGLSQCAASMRENGVPLWPVSALLKPARALCQVGTGVSDTARSALATARTRGA